jgi:outer membrane immunogenic protein
MKKLTFAISLLAVGAFPASAADLAVKARPVAVPIYNWTGFYVGVSAGGIFNDPGLGNNVDIFQVTVTGPAGPNSTPAQNAIARTLGDNRLVSWLAGAQAGYNKQFDNNAVLGIEADISGTDLRFSNSITNLTPVIGAGPKDITTTGSQRLDWLGTVRGRVGYAGVENLLVYGTGGLAYGGTSAAFGVASTIGFGRIGIPFNLVAQDSSTKVGWTVGGGAEVNLWKDWSVKGEYLYYDLGRTNLAVTHTVNPPPGFTAATSAAFTGSLVRVGLNYHFAGGPIIAKY